MRAAEDVLGASEEAIAKGSKSFAVAAKLFDAQTRADAVMLYAWCRFCDDVVDGQELGHGRVAHAQSPQDRLDALYEATRKAFRGAPSAHPAFAAFTEVVRRHAIPERYPLALLDGFRMDVEGARYDTLDDTLTYCWHVAGVVGVMMAFIMGARDDAVLNRACDLGLAFQLTNIARDVVEDADIGRVYVPGQLLAAAGVKPARIADPRSRAALAGVVTGLLDEAEPYYDQALLGIRALPLRSALAIATARRVYRAIGTKVRKAGPKAWDRRQSTSTPEKLLLLGGGIADALASRLPRRTPPRPDHLWTRPS